MLSKEIAACVIPLLIKSRLKAVLGRRDSRASRILLEDHLYHASLLLLEDVDGLKENSCVFG
jgi:hypothetical protein